MPMRDNRVVQTRDDRQGEPPDRPAVILFAGVVRSIWGERCAHKLWTRVEVSL